METESLLTFQFNKGYSQSVRNFISVYVPTSVKMSSSLTTYRVYLHANRRDIRDSLEFVWEPRSACSRNVRV